MLIVDVLDVLLLVIDALIFQLRVLMINVTIFNTVSQRSFIFCWKINAST